MLERREAKYWIASDPRNETLPLFIDDGMIGIPKFYVVDARGVVAGGERASEQRIEELLRDTFDLSIGRPLHARLASAVFESSPGRADASRPRAGRKLPLSKGLPR